MQRGPVGSEKEALLVLEDGTFFRGTGFGAVGKTEGEVVFNTGMVGYPESITDPSYYGQILIQTYPLIGNYGVCPDHFESSTPKIKGYVVRELCRGPSHWASELTLEDWLEASGVPGIEGIDTRLLTKKIRVHGTMLGILLVYEKGDAPDIDSLLRESRRIPDPNKRDLVAEVTNHNVVRYDVGGRFDVVVIDCGVKKSIIDSLLSLKLNVTQVPSNTSAQRVLDINPDGIVLSNGPGDPKMVPYLIEEVRKLIRSGSPILGVCLGNQLIALALGGDTYKLKFGHRGQNHPCLRVGTWQCFITSQNHGYAVDADSLSGTGLKVTLINANDRTVEGITHSKLPVSAVQFHPEASPGPLDTKFIFERFLHAIESCSG